MSGYLRHYPSTPHLDSFKGSPGSSHRSISNYPLTTATSNMSLMTTHHHSYMPTSTFSTFQQKKPAPPQLPSKGSLMMTDSKSSRCYQDDPNPYKVSNIDEYRIKVKDPFLPCKAQSHRGSSNQLLTFYNQQQDPHLGDDDEDDDVREALGQLDINRRRLSSSAYGDDDDGTTTTRSHPLSYSSSTKVHRSSTLKSTSSGGGVRGMERMSHMSGSASVSASSTGTGDIEIIDNDYDADYDGFRVGSAQDADRVGGDHHHDHHHHHHHHGNGIIIPGPISDSSCTSSEGYSSVSAATSSSCSASDPDPYAVPTTGPSSSPDEGSILEANDSGIESPTTRISDSDERKIRCAFAGRKTMIWVANCLANLYTMRKSNFMSRPGSALSNQQHQSRHHHNNQSFAGQQGEGEWVLKYTGVPVLLLDSGETKSRDKRRIQIVLAELGSGLALWKDVIDNLSSYKVMEGSQTFHTMHLSTDHTKIIGLSFDDEECAQRFFADVDRLTSDFANISLSGSKSKSKSKKDKAASKAAAKTAKHVKPRKADISQPCGFNHVSSLTSSDKRRFPSIQNFVLGHTPPTAEEEELHHEDNEQGIVPSGSHDDFHVTMSPLTLAERSGSDLHF